MALESVHPSLQAVLPREERVQRIMIVSLHLPAIGEMDSATRVADAGIDADLRERIGEQQTLPADNHVIAVAKHTNGDAARAPAIEIIALQRVHNPISISNISLTASPVALMAHPASAVNVSSDAVVLTLVFEIR